MTAHEQVEARVTARIEGLEVRHNQNLERIYGKLEEFQQHLMTRPPLWASSLITVLSTAIGVLLTILVRH